MTQRKSNRTVLASEVRKLEVQLTEDQRVKAGKELAESLEENTRQELLLQEVRDRFKGIFGEIKSNINRLTGIVNHGVEYRDVSCEWVHMKGAEEKHLVRIDSGEVVEAMPISEAELQMSLGAPQEPKGRPPGADRKVG